MVKSASIREQRIKRAAMIELRKYFENTRHGVHYIKKVTNKKDVGKNVQSKMVGIISGLRHEYLIKGTNYRMDLYDPFENIAYEIALGDGTEIFKDCIKAMLAKVEKLVIFCRDYPHASMSGYGYMKKQWRAMKDKLPLHVELVNFMEKPPLKEVKNG